MFQRSRCLTIGKPKNVRLDPVLIIDETHGKPLAIGVSLITGEEMVENDSGKAVETKHYVGDEIWNFEL